MLIFPLKKEWYDKIKSGEKTVEYREVKPYWTKRISLNLCLPMSALYPPKAVFKKVSAIGYCKLRLGYTQKFMTAIITKIAIVDGKDTDLHIDKPVYAIHLADVEEF